MECENILCFSMTALITILLAQQCFLWSSCSAKTVTKNITTDEAALLAFKARLFPFDTFDTLATNWSAASSVCDWIGVTCNSHHQRVSALHLSGVGLVGTIPPSFGNLSFLVSIDISCNAFHGHLPKELAHLRRLKEINFEYNCFRGGLPSWLGFLPKLQYLNLRHNNFTGTIPPSLGNLSKLQRLDLNFNLLEGDITQKISNLQNLNWLTMESNRLTGSIPLNIFNISTLRVIGFTDNRLSGYLPQDMCARIPKLRELHLSLNQLYGEIPWTGLSGCSELQELSISYNNFTGPISSEIGNLTMLKELYMSANDLRGEIPKEMGNLHSLEILTMRSMGLTGQIPASIFNISSLRNFDPSSNSLSGSLPLAICSHIPVMDILMLEYNKLTGIIPKDIGNCTSLTKLSLQNNEFTDTIPDVIGNLRKLKLLALGLNSLRGTIPSRIFNISTLEEVSFATNQLSGNVPWNMGYMLPNLQELYLGDNGLGGIFPDFISNASKLTELDISANKFTGAIPNTFGSLGLLGYLSLGLNNFSSEPLSQKLSFLILSLANCKHLRELRMNNIFLESILPISVGNLSSTLEFLDASHSGIKGTIPDEIGNLSSLAFLHLFGNNLTGSMPMTVRMLRNLQVLNLGDNQISGTIPKDLCQLPKLGSLNLSANQICGSMPPCLGNVSSLRNFYLSSNKLNSSIPISFWNLKYLLYFDVSSNALNGHLPPGIGNLEVAVEIDLSLNQFSGSIPAAIGGLQDLVELSLANNRLQGPIPETFQHLISLELLDLSHNNISGVIPRSLEELSHLRYFNVSFNRLEGEIPSGGPFGNFTNQSFWSNEGLCGAPRFQVPLCHSTTTRTSRTRKVLLLVCIPLVTLLTLLTLISTFICRRRSKILTPENLLPTVTHERISYHELRQATEGFSESNLLGMGSFGSVYKGTLPNGMTYAMKVFDFQSEGAFNSFDTECEILRNIRHRNLTKVISTCSNPDFRALVLEYMPNGNLERWLYSHSHFLDILQRLDIMIEVACALDYLHHGYSMVVVHCDLKPSNILLDEGMVAHLCDFGISKLLGEGESVAKTMTLATLGYMAPEYGSEGLVSRMCDIYSFGIILMETFTRTKPTDEKFIGELTLKRWVNNALRKTVVEVIDANLITPEDEFFSAKVLCVSSIMELALNCTAESPDERINVKDVLTALRKIRLQFLRKRETVEGT